jgi:hypothetical protein
VREMRTIPTILAAAAIAVAPVVFSAPQAHAGKCDGMTPSDTIMCQRQQQILNQPPPPQVAANDPPEEEPVEPQPIAPNMNPNGNGTPGHPGYIPPDDPPKYKGPPDIWGNG